VAPPQGCAWSVGARTLAPAAYRFALTVRNTISSKAAITEVTVTVAAGLAPVVSIAPTGFFAPRKVSTPRTSFS